MALHSPSQADSITRFRVAHDRNWHRISREIATGRKETHWMWFAFPQLRVFAKSETAHYYGLADKAEALNFLDDDVLRVHLASATMGVLRQQRLMFSDVDTRKLHRCMTLFREIVKDPTLPDSVLGRWFGGELHQPTMDALAGKPVTVQNQWTPGRRSAQGRVEVRGKAARILSRHWEARASNDPMDSTEVEQFLRGFNMPPAMVRAITREWIADQTRAHTQGWEAADEEALHG
jgi:uncharacterized protein (DUF1810 family)